MTLALLITAASGAWAAITTEDIGKVICTDGSLYATKILAQNDGKTAAAMIGYVDTENNKALAIALTDGNNNMDWTQACEYCTGLNTSLPVANGTWVLPTEEQWKSVLTLEEVVPGYEVYKSESLNTKLNAAKGNALDNESAPYWSATESSGSYVKCFSFKYGMASVGTVNKTVADGSMTRAFLEIELSGIEVTTNAEEGETTFTEASFNMPAFDATVDYEIVRDLADRTAANITVGEGQEAETLEADSRLRIKKTDNGYVFVKALAISFSDELENVTIAKDGFETAKLKPQFYLQQDDAQNPWTLVTDLNTTTGLPNNLQPGQVYCVTFVSGEGSAYDGETEKSFAITLFEGYEVTVPAGEFATYYRDDDNLVLDDETTGAKLYTITTVSGSTATVTEITSANKEMPFLIYNSSDEAKTFLLIPTESVTNQSFYSGFIGTAEATTIAASDATADRYAFNGKQFVWVKNAIDVAANKAWLQISNTNARTITLVFDEATGVNAVDNGQLTIDNDGWYDLNGRKLEGMPTRKGVYIINGRKVVIK